MAAANEMTKALNGESFDYDTPLQTGAIHYPGTQMPGESGNSVIFAHSSYYTNDGGRYKTIFGKIIELDAGEEVLLPKSGKNLSLFTCTPIGGITGRWYVSARLVEDSASMLPGSTLSTSMKVKINRAMFGFKKKVNTLSNEARLKALATVAYRIELAEAKYEGNERILDILKYIELKLAMML